MNFFSGCVRLPIRHNCGVSAWTVIHRVLRDTTNTLMPSCTFTGNARKKQKPEMDQAVSNDMNLPRMDLRKFPIEVIFPKL